MAKPGPTIAAGAARKLLGMLEARQIDPTMARSSVGLSTATLADKDARIPLEKLHALWEAALPLLGRDDGALLAAETYVPGDYGMVGFVAMNAPTLREGLRRVIRYVGLWTDEPRLELGDDGTLHVIYRHSFEDRPGLRCATEAALAEILHAARLLTREAIRPRDVRFTHRAPGNEGAYEAFFGTAVRFGEKSSMMVFQDTDLALELPRADLMLGVFLQSLADEAISKHGAAEPTLEDRIRAIVAEEGPTGELSSARLAKRLMMSERTLRRRLEEHGTSYRDVVDRARADLARRYLKDPSLPLAEVAFLLGFAEPSAFFRAFKRWTGETPGMVRGR